MSQNPITAETSINVASIELTSFEQKLQQHTIFCSRSGIALGTLQIYLQEGHLPYLLTHSEAIYRHPFYQLTEPVLLKKLESAIVQCSEYTEDPPLSVQHRLQLLTSAVTHALGSVVQEKPGLPSFAVCLGSSSRLLTLARWYWYETSKRTKLPTYHISKVNGNSEWENFRYWLDICFEIKTDWQASVRKMQHNAALRESSEDIREIGADIFRKIDINKVWNWIALQLTGNGNVAKGTLETYRNMFVHGLENAELWHKDDVEDLTFDIIQYCDENHDIMFAIRKRLSALKQVVEDFYGSFTLLRSNSRTVLGNNDHATPQELELMESYDKQVEVLETLPEMPQQKDFATKGLFMQAMARWNILKGRFEMRGKPSSVEPCAQSQNPVPDASSLDNSSSVGEL